MKIRPGLTFIELIVTLSLLSIILTLVMPSTNIFTNIYERKELKTLVRDLKTTRTKAVAEGVSYSFHTHSDGKGYYIGLEDKVVRRVSLNYINFISRFNFTFYYSGSTSHSGTIKVRGNNEKIYEITVAVGTSKISLKED